jgi:hypothetical protein
MELKVVHVVILGLGVAVLVANAVGQSLPQYAPVAHAVAGVCASVASTLGVLSPSAAQGPATPAAQEAK